MGLSAPGIFPEAKVVSNEEGRKENRLKIRIKNMINISKRPK